MKSFVLAFLLAPAMWSAAVSAHDTAPVYDRIHLSASSGRQVETDTLVAIMYREQQAARQASAADEVNRDVRWAIDLAKARGITVRTAAYRTQPVYEKGQIQGWRVHQSIRLESADGAALAAVLGDLQQRLSIQSLTEVLSPKGRRRAEESLIAEALSAFTRRAALIAESLERPGHRIVELHVNTSGGRPPPVGMRAMARSTASETAAPPAIETGSIRVEVQVSGSIELEAP